MLELEAPPTTPSLSQTTSRREGRMQRCTRFSRTIPTANKRWAIRGAGAHHCFQVSPCLAGAAQPGADVCKHSQPSLPPRPAWRGGGGPLTFHCYAWLFSKRESGLSVPERKEPLILEEPCVPDFDLPQIRSLHTPKRPCYISEVWSWLSLLLTCGVARPSTPTVAHPSSKMGPWAPCPGQKP